FRTHFRRSTSIIRFAFILLLQFHLLWTSLLCHSLDSKAFALVWSIYKNCHKFAHRRMFTQGQFLDYLILSLNSNARGSLYSSEGACRAVFRALPVTARMSVLKLLSWVPQTIMGKEVELMKSLSIVRPVQRLWTLNEDFARGIRMSLSAFRNVKS